MTSHPDVPTPPAPAPRRGAGRRPGFTLIEMLVVLAILGVLVRFSVPSVARSIRISRVNRAADVLASDLDRAFEIAARQRRPVRVSWDATAHRYAITDRRSGTVLLSRPIGTASSDVGAVQVVFLPTPIDIYPGGVASSALLVKLRDPSYSRSVQMTRAGLTLVGP